VSRREIDLFDAVLVVKALAIMAASLNGVDVDKAQVRGVMVLRLMKLVSL
jgi:hypothetical protein